MKTVDDLVKEIEPQLEKEAENYRNGLRTKVEYLKCCIAILDMSKQDNLDDVTNDAKDIFDNDYAIAKEVLTFEHRWNNVIKAVKFECL